MFVTKHAGALLPFRRTLLACDKTPTHHFTHHRTSELALQERPRVSKSRRLVCFLLHLSSSEPKVLKRRKNR